MSSADPVANAEYASLRSEIIQADARCRDLLLFTTGAVGAILAFWFKDVGAEPKELKPTNFLFAVVTVTLALGATFVGGNLVASYRRSIWRISSYLVTFVETRPDAGRWETRLNDAEAARVAASASAASSTHGIRSDKHLLMFLQTICALAIVLFIVVQAGPLLAIASAPRDVTTSLQLVLGVVVVTLHFMLYVILLVWTKRTFDALERFGPIHRHFIERWGRQSAAESAKATSPP